ncbi:MAG TPA: SDR family oxidoreductase, partial [Acidimicrobiales bacterium]|nr:SDR family oxidoreductase [Acidimicrobiales bacterium]
RATAGVLVRDAAHVVIAGRTAAKLENVVEQLAPDAEAAGGSIRYSVCDALDEEHVRGLVEFTAAPTGRVDMAVAVPGGGGMAPVLRYSVDMLEAIMRKNITSTYVLLKHAGAAMVRAGGGSFVAVSSMQAVQSAPMLAAYCAAKAGLEMLCKVAADELGEHNVRINAVRPGLTRTDATVAMVNDPVTVDAYFDQQPISQLGEAEDIAWAIRYFLGPEAKWTTGQFLTVDGGATIRRFPDLGPLYRTRLGDELDKAARGEVD